MQITPKRGPYSYSMQLHIFDMAHVLDVPLGYFFEGLSPELAVSKGRKLSRGA